MPALSHFFGLKWADIADMPRGELDAYLDELHSVQAANRTPPQRRGRRR